MMRKSEPCKDHVDALYRQREQGTKAERPRRGEVGWLKLIGDVGGWGGCSV